MVLSANTNLDESVSQESNQSRFLDEDFLKVIGPFLKIQKLLGLSRVDIKDGSVTPPTIFHKCYTMVWLIMMTISILQLIISYKARFSDNRKMFYMFTMAFLSIEVIFAGFLIYARFCDNQGNINLYLQMQKIDRIMGKNRPINVMLQKRNRITAYSLALFFALVFLASYILAKDEFGILELVGATYTLEIVAVELFCSLSHMRFFYTRVCQLNSQINIHTRETKCDIAILSNVFETANRLIMSTEWQQCDPTDIYLKEIFTGFMLFKELYSFQAVETLFQMLLFCAFFVFWILFTFEHGIISLQSEETDKSMLLLDFINLLALALIYMLLLLWLSSGTEAFMREVRKTKHLSILMMCRYADGPLRTTAKNMLKLIEETPPDFSVYGMWSMDAQLIIDIFNLITNFILTILQFTFL
ncbi:uncharacterized protein LOC134662654 [Cydia amplana]|uniref:uncharacterized protein LOC134662654 n=1 Tax=Cydia amplana TaxID=1869771 RepID=UPI002FE69111